MEKPELSSPIIFYLGSKGTIANLIFAELIYALAGSLSCGALMNIMFERFNASSRYTGNSFSWAIGAAIFSGTSPTIVGLLGLIDNRLSGLYLLVLGSLCLATMQYIDKKHPL